MNFSFKQVIKKFFFLEHNHSGNLKRLGNAVSLSNTMVCFWFYFWFFMHINNKAGMLSTNSIVILIIMHLYINSMFIYWSLFYETPKWSIWAWSSLIFLLPTGLILIFFYNDQKYWNLQTTKENTFSVFHAFTNSTINIDAQAFNSLNFLKNYYPSEIQKIFSSTNLDEQNIKEWNNKFKFFIIALHEALKNTKKTNINSVEFGAHWYDDRRFDFALRDPKSLIMPIRYKYSVGFIILDEFNNYKKIITAKKEIKANMKFGPAKTICLHWGKGFKVYVNE